MCTSDDLSSEQWVMLRDAPSIPNLRFRHFKGESDYPHMVAVAEGANEVDQLELVISVEDVAREFKYSESWDPYQDLLFAEVDDKVIGFTRLWWSKDPSGIYLYNQSVDLLPE